MLMFILKVRTQVANSRRSPPSINESPPPTSIAGSRTGFDMDRCDDLTSRSLDFGIAASSTSPFRLHPLLAGDKSLASSHDSAFFQTTTSPRHGRLVYGGGPGSVDWQRALEESETRRLLLVQKMREAQNTIMASGCYCNIIIMF